MGRINVTSTIFEEPLGSNNENSQGGLVVSGVGGSAVGLQG